MLTAIPLKMNKPDSAVSPLFGHAKWFAFVTDDGQVRIEANPYDGGMPVIDWLLAQGVKRIVTPHIGARPFVYLLEQGVKAWYPGEGRITLSEAIQMLRNPDETMERITLENVEQFARHGGSGHRH